jgi:hypothetical protein
LAVPPLKRLSFVESMRPCRFRVEDDEVGVEEAEWPPRPSWWWLRPAIL